MVSLQSVQSQLKRIGYNHISWGKTEVDELPDIILPEEVIHECVNGIYEAGFCLLVATNFRVLLIDKKPLNYLTVLDLRFDMINEIEYSHRLMSAQITISTGSKTLRFRSYNQQRLRKLIGLVQHSMAEAKHRQSKNEEGQNQHLGLINQQLQTYLIAQIQNQQELSRQIQQTQPVGIPASTVPIINANSTDLANYLRLQNSAEVDKLPQAMTAYSTNGVNSNELLEEGIREVFGKRAQSPTIY